MINNLYNRFGIPGEKDLFLSQIHKLGRHNLHVHFLLVKEQFKHKYAKPNYIKN